MPLTLEPGFALLTLTVALPLPAVFMVIRVLAGVVSSLSCTFQMLPLVLSAVTLAPLKVGTKVPLMPGSKVMVRALPEKL